MAFASTSYFPTAGSIDSGGAALTAGRVVFASDGDSLDDDGALAWDDTNKTLEINSPTGGATSTLAIKGTKSFASGASAVWNSTVWDASTATISGSTNITTATGVNFLAVGQPTLSAGTALTVTNAATLYIADAPVGAGAGPAAVTNAYAIWADAGTVRVDGTLSAQGGIEGGTGSAVTLDLIGTSHATQGLVRTVWSDSSTNTALDTTAIVRKTTGTASAGIGASLIYTLSNGVAGGATTKTAAALTSTLTTVTDTAEVGKLELRLISAGTVPAAGSGQHSWTPGQYKAPAGTEGAPGVAIGDAGDGFFSPGAGTVSFTNGARRFQLSSSTMAFDSNYSILMGSAGHITMNATGFFNQGVTTGITAGTTQTQAGATALTSQINFVTVVSVDDDGVALPAAVAGRVVKILNRDAAQRIQVWPASGDAIDAQVADAVDPNKIAAGAEREYVALDGTTWHTFISA